MLTSEVIAHFGSESAVANAVGVSRQAVNHWKRKKVVPPLSAARIAKITRGRIKFDPADYNGWYKQRS